MPFVDAERTQLYLRCALFGPSGSGKTMTALRMAKGIAEKMGVPVAVIDTEARSATKYADRFAFKVDNLEKKTIDHYLASMEEAKKAGYKVLVIDSLSHGWRELTEEVDRITQASNSKNSLLSWGKVGPKQKRFIDAILNYPGHIIVTMRSKTEWVIGTGENGKIAAEKLGLAPEQGKGIEYEFDLLLELKQNHFATITKDRTGKYQDVVIEKPGEDFGTALYEWLASGKPEKPATTDAPAAKGARKPQKSQAVPEMPKPEKPGKTASLKEQGSEIMKEIGAVITASKDGVPYFSEDEKEEARKVIKETRLDENGITDLMDFKAFLSEELAKRESKKAA
jgi:nucleoside-triphosphatase THEP1